MSKTSNMRETGIFLIKNTTHLLSNSRSECRQPGGLGVLRGVAEGVAEEARTRGFASLAFASFAFHHFIMQQIQKVSILEYA